VNILEASEKYIKIHLGEDYEWYINTFKNKIYHKNTGETYDGVLGSNELIGYLLGYEEWQEYKEDTPQNVETECKHEHCSLEDGSRGWCCRICGKENIDISTLSQSEEECEHINIISTLVHYSGINLNKMTCIDCGAETTPNLFSRGERESGMNSTKECPYCGPSVTNNRINCPVHGRVVRSTINSQEEKLRKTWNLVHELEKENQELKKERDCLKEQLFLKKNSKEQKKKNESR